MNDRQLIQSFLKQRKPTGIPRVSVRPTQQVSLPETAIYSGYVASNERDFRLTGRERYRTYAEILKNVAPVVRSIRDFLFYIGGATPNIKPAKVEDQNKDRAREVAELYEQIIFKDPETPFQETIKKMALTPFIGFSTLEWTSRTGIFKGKEIETLLDVRAISQQTVEKWDREEGRIIGIEQRLDYSSTPRYIPRWKLLYTADQVFSDSPEGLGSFDLLATHAIRVIKLQQMQFTAHQYDSVGITIGKAPYTDLLEKGVPKEEITKRIKPIFDFLTAAKKGDIQGTLVLDSAPYFDNNPESQRPATAPQYSIERITGSGEALRVIAEYIEREERNCARILDGEGQFLGDKAAGTRDLSDSKDHNFNLKVDAMLSLISTEWNNFMKYFAVFNDVPLELIPTMEFESIESASADSINTAFRNIIDAYNIVDVDDPILDEYRVQYGFSPIPEEVKELRRRQRDEDRTMSIQRQQMQLSQNPTADPEEDE